MSYKMVAGRDDRRPSLPVGKAMSRGITRDLVSLILPSVHGYDAVQRIRPAWDGTVRIGPAPRGRQSLRFSGGPDGLKVVPSGGFRTLVGTGSFTVMALVNIRQIGARQLILGDFDSAGSNAGFWMEQTAGNQWLFGSVNGTPTQFSAGPSGSVTVGYHWIEAVLQTYGTAVWNGYVDGTLIGTTGWSGTMRAGVDYRIGRGGAYTALGFNGDIVEHIVFKRVLDPQERARIRNDPGILRNRPPTVRFKRLAGSVTNQSVTATNGSTASFVKAGRKILSVLQGSTPTIAKRGASAFAATCGSTATSVKRALKNLAATNGGTATLATASSVSQALSATCTNAASIVKRGLKIVIAANGSTATLVRRGTTILAATCGSTATIVKLGLKNLVVAVSSSPVLTPVAGAVSQALTATAGATATMVRRASKLVTLAQASAATAIKRVSHLFGTLTQGSTASLVATVGVVNQVLSATASATATLVTAYRKAMTVAQSAAVSIVKRASVALTSSSGNTATALRRAPLRLTATVSTVASVLRTYAVGLVLSAVAGVIASIVAVFHAGGQFNSGRYAWRVAPRGTEWVITSRSGTIEASHSRLDAWTL